MLSVLTIIDLIIYLIICVCLSYCIIKKFGFLYISIYLNTFLSLFNRSVVGTMTLTREQTTVASCLQVLLSLLINKDQIYRHLNPHKPNAAHSLLSIKPFISPALWQVQGIRPWRAQMNNNNWHLH